MKDIKSMKFSLNEFTYQINQEENTITVHRMTPEDWVNMTYKKYQGDNDVDYLVCGRYTYIVDNKGHVAKSCCNSNDLFENKIGVALAYARLRNSPIHPYYCASKKSSREEIPCDICTEFPEGTRVRMIGWKRYGTVIKQTHLDPTMVRVKWDNDVITILAKTCLARIDTGET